MEEFSVDSIPIKDILAKKKLSKDTLNGGCSGYDTMDIIALFMFAILICVGGYLGLTQYENKTMLAGSVLAILGGLFGVYRTMSGK